MRVVAINNYARHVGGIESYLDLVLPAIAAAGHEVALLYETGKREPHPISLPANSACWSAEALGHEGAIRAMKQWKPDVLFLHSVDDPSFEAALRGGGGTPTVMFAHQYHGTCVSGTKAHAFPTTVPCARVFGPACLALYYPRRCGGLDPRTMLRDYRRQRLRLSLVRGYEAIVTHSEHMRQEYVRHGVPSQRVHQLPFPVATTATPYLRSDTASPPAEWRLLFVGRMERLKGGQLFLKALPQVARALSTPLHVTFIGDGRERATWEGQARTAEGRVSNLRISFAGWVDRSAISDRYAESHLLVVPSLWPEPLGMVGPEAGLQGVPAAAFRVGGVPHWLEDGINGHLADGAPPKADHLAEAIVKCLDDPKHYAALSRGAHDRAQRFLLDAHVDALIRVFARHWS